ncbi:hypothetical protein ABZ490_40685 [Streptomyces sp. NPDC005811]|uniref:hypothetical protein n=1 Tax=Streptomyces sp. NPDC005811 TaxID=3154565 RepID=UPI0033CA4C85
MGSSARGRPDLQETGKPILEVAADPGVHARTPSGGRRLAEAREKGKRIRELEMEREVCKRSVAVRVK